MAVAASFAAGLLLRIATLGLPGTEDLQVWKTWSYGATQDLTSMYGVGGSPPERALVWWGEQHTTVDYPPGALYALSVAGHVYRLIDPGYTDSPVLTVTIKLAILLADVLVCFLVWRLARDLAGPAPAIVAALSYWLNPAIILDGAILGYLDPWLAAPVMAALVWANRGAGARSGAALAAGVLIKVQALLAAPFVALLLACRASRPFRTCSAAGLGFAGLTCAALLPFAVRGALPNVQQGVASLLRHDMLSGTAANFWWLVTWLLRASYAVQDLGSWAAWTMRVRILGVRRFIELGYPNPRPIASAVVLAIFGWAVYRAYTAVRRGSSPSLVLVAAAFAMHAYFVLAVQVHENHLFLAIPVAVTAAAIEPGHRGPALWMSAILALNLWLFYGLGRGWPGPSRAVTVIDATVWLSAINVAAFLWHARVVHNLTGQTAARATSM